MRDPVSHQCPKTRSDALDGATQTRHAKRPDHYVCDTVEQLFTHLSSLGVEWSQVQNLSARHCHPDRPPAHGRGVAAHPFATLPPSCQDRAERGGHSETGWTRADF